MSKAGLDNRHRNKDGEISSKHGNTLIRTLRKIYGQSFAAGYPETEKLREVLLKLNETSLSQLRRDHETGHFRAAAVEAEKGTVTSFAIQEGPSSFAIFDTFDDEAGRDAHLNGRVAAALMAKAGELLAKPPAIHKISILADKLPKSASEKHRIRVLST